MGRDALGGEGRTDPARNARVGVTNMTNFVKLLKDESGASAAEYALILAIVGSALAVAAIALGDTISDSMNTQSNRITDCTDGSC